MNPPQLSVMLRTYAAEDPGTWQPLLDTARAADAAGVDRVLVSDHVVFGEHLEAYGRPETGGVEGGKQPTGSDGHWLEPLTTLSVLCGMTSRVRLCTNILIAALRRPVVLAKAAATLDVLSGGRLDLGVGIGWQREEYEAAGLQFGDRGRLLDHTLEVCQRLWRETRATYESDDLRFDGIHMMPKPLSPHGVPLWISGTLNDRVVARVARFGSGWIPWGPDLVDLGASIARMRDGVAALGRDPDGIGVVGSILVAPDELDAIDAQATMAVVPELVASGVTDVRLFMPFPESRAAIVDQVGPLAAAFREAVAA